MIKQGEKIINIRTGQIMIFLKTGAETNGGLAYKDEIRLIKPPWVLQNIIYQILAPFGKLMGYRAD